VTFPKKEKKSGTIPWWVIAGVALAIMVAIGVIFWMQKTVPSSVDAGEAVAEPEADAGPPQTDPGGPVEPEAPDAGTDVAAPVTAPDTGAAPQRASLNVTSEPEGCKVLLDKAALPEPTPVVEAEIEANRDHTVVVMCTGYKPDSQTVTPKAGEKLSLTFTPTKVPAPPPPPSFGLLRLNTEPWAKVFLGAKELGITPLLDIKLPPGRHQLKLVNDKQGLTRTITVVITAGKTTSIVKNLAD
jgi:serine/threonine-protein kinase